MKKPKSQAYFWTEEVQKCIRESEEAIKAGQYKDFESVEELLNELNSDN